MLSVAWEWQRLVDGRLVISPPQTIMSNLMLITDQGYDMGPVETEKALQVWLEGLSWRDAVHLAIPMSVDSRH